MISLCLHLNINHLQIPTRIKLFQLARAVDRHMIQHVDEWPQAIVCEYGDDHYFFEVPEFMDEIVHSKAPSDLKDALQLANSLNIRWLRIDPEGSVLQQLHYYGA